MNVKMSKVKKQLKISRKNELDAFRRRAKVTGVWLIDSHQNMTVGGIYQFPNDHISQTCPSPGECVKDKEVSFGIH